MSNGWNGFTEEWLKKHNENQGKSNQHKHRQADPVIQKPEAGNEESQNRKVVPGNRKRKQKKNAGDNPAIERSVFCAFRFSDNRIHDLDGVFSSVCDCLVHAGLLPDDSIKHIQRQATGTSKTLEPGCEIVIIEYLED